MKFTHTQHQTWEILFKRQIPNLEKFACKEFLEGFARLKLPEHRIPTLTWLNRRIEPTSGWRIMRTPIRYLSDRQWAAHMSKKEFPITNFIRAQSELDFTPEPDIFHDILGHLPMLMHPKLSKLVEVFSHAYTNATSKRMPIIAQLWWNTIEFGLVKQGKDTKIFGAGLMSSFGEIAHAASGDIPTDPFTIDRGIQKPRAVSSFHSEFLIINSVEQLQKDLAAFFSTWT